MYVPTPLSWSKAAVNSVVDRPPATSPSKVFTMVATPDGSAVTTSGSGFSSDGTKELTAKVPEALMRPIVGAGGYDS